MCNCVLADCSIKEGDFCYAFALEKDAFYVRQINLKKEKTNENLIVKNLLHVFNRSLELLHWVGGFSLQAFYRVMERVSTIAF